MELYTSTSAPLCIPKILPIPSSTQGKKVNTSSPIPIERNTKKCRALNFSFLAISRARKKIITQEMIKKTSSKFTPLKNNDIVSCLF